MTPLPVNPKVVILLSDNNEVVGVASNIAPTPELDVQVTRSQRLFDEMALGKPFATGTLSPQSSVPN
jgi:hypothetical protein